MTIRLLPINGELVLQTYCLGNDALMIDIKKTCIFDIRIQTMCRKSVNRNLKCLVETSEAVKQELPT